MALDSILADQHPDCWGALDFVDNHMQPITKTVVIASVGMGRPPGGGDERIYFIFKDDRRKAFLKKTARVFIAVHLQTLDPKDMVGAYLQITAKMARSPKGGEVLSMTVIAASFPKSRQQAPERLPPPATRAPTEPAPEDRAPEATKPHEREPGED